MNASSTPLNDQQAKPPVIGLIIKALQILLIAILGLFFWPFYIVGTLIWGRPPNVVHLAQVSRYLRLAWVVQPPAPGLSWQTRVWLTNNIIRKLLLIPFTGSAWLLDELLYGRTLNKLDVIKPLFVISGGRSGSTQISRYIEADPTVTAPNLLQCMMPYLWLWRLAPRTIGRFITPDGVRTRLEAIMPPEVLERHEFDPFKSDTFDGAMYSPHLNPLAFYLGPEVSAREFNFARFARPDRKRMEKVTVQLIDRIARKQRLFIGEANTDTPRRFFLKGHFLCAADALEHHYPDATFLTILRDPAGRIQSGINYLQVNPSDPAVGSPPWAWLSASLLQTETAYCRIEQAWYSKETGARRCVVRFTNFVTDLEGTMTHVYHICFDQDQLPPHVPHSHPPRERKHYTVNRSLNELGIDASAVRQQLADYIAWCQSQ